jgi:hypothetical protein
VQSLRSQPLTEYSGSDAVHARLCWVIHDELVLIPVFRFLFKLFLFLLPILLVGMPVFLLVSAVQPLPLVEASDSLKHEDVGRIKGMLKAHDPREMRHGERRVVMVNDRDLRLLFSAILPVAGQQRAAVELGDGSLAVQYSLQLPENTLGRYLNLSLRVVERDGGLQIHNMKFGDVAVPGWLLTPALLLADKGLKDRFEEYRGAMAALQEVRLREDAVSVVYQWDAQLAEKVQDLGRDYLIPEVDRERILTYYAEISRQSRLSTGKHSLADLLQPLFALAQQRSAQAGNSQAENRGLFLALGIAQRGSAVESILGAGNDIPERPSSQFSLTLGRRGDLASHFALSAAITAASSAALADAVGVFKEMDDSRGGSGFSFADLLADRSGVTLAEESMGPRAAEIQAVLAAGGGEAVFMPDISRLPEGLQAMQFKERFEDLDSSLYAELIAEIERRIAACAVYQH